VIPAPLAKNWKPFSPKLASLTEIIVYWKKQDFEKCFRVELLYLLAIYSQTWCGIGTDMTNTQDDPEELKDPEFVEDDYNETPPSDVVAYNELRSCADLFRMYEEGILDIQPSFQREIVWPSSQQTRFVDSLIKQLPIPSMCLALDYKNDRWIVIDGLQRMATIIKFLKGDDWKLSKLEDINKDIAGKSAAAIKNAAGKLRSYYSRVQNTSLPINVLRCDFSKKTHMEYLFTIFHRLNAGGVKLNNQEIRNCIYGGTLNSLLSTLDRRPNWRKLNRMTKDDSNYRFVKQELILRFFAFFDVKDEYKGQIAKFLNDYMYLHRNAGGQFIDQKRQLFQRVISLLADQVFPDGPETRIPTSVMEATLVGMAHNIDRLEQLSADDLISRYNTLRNRDEFNEEAVAEGLSKVIKVMQRFNAAEEVFSA